MCLCAHSRSHFLVDTDEHWFYNLSHATGQIITEIRLRPALVEPASKLTNKHDACLQNADVRCSRDAEHCIDDLWRDESVMTAHSVHTRYHQTVSIRSIKTHFIVKLITSALRIHYVYNPFTDLFTAQCRMLVMTLHYVLYILYCLS